MAYKFIQHFITPGGDLDPHEQEKTGGQNPNWIQWVKGNKEISLDGDFTIEELKEIVVFMSGAVLAEERQETIKFLRDLCNEFGDNDWPDDLYLPDILKKHLAKHLWAKQVED